MKFLKQGMKVILFFCQHVHGQKWNWWQEIKIGNTLEFWQLLLRKISLEPRTPWKWSGHSFVVVHTSESGHKKIPKMSTHHNTCFHYLLPNTLSWRSFLSKVARAHSPPYTATSCGDISYQEKGKQSHFMNFSSFKESLTHIRKTTMIEWSHDEISGSILVSLILHFSQSSSTFQTTCHDQLLMTLVLFTKQKSY